MSVLLRQPELCEAPLLILVDDEPRDLAAADVEQVHCRRPNFLELYSACLAASAHVEEHEDALAVELPILVHFSAVLLPGSEIGAPGR